MEEQYDAHVFAWLAHRDGYEGRPSPADPLGHLLSLSYLRHISSYHDEDYGLVWDAIKEYERLREELNRETARADVNDWIRANQDMTK